VVHLPVLGCDCLCSQCQAAQRPRRAQLLHLLQHPPAAGVAQRRRRPAGVADQVRAPRQHPLRRTLERTQVSHDFRQAGPMMLQA
jgi:hypothetical protein